MTERKYTLDEIRLLQPDKDTAGSFIKGLNGNQFIIAGMIGMGIWVITFGIGFLNDIRDNSLQTVQNAGDISEMREAFQELADATSESGVQTRQDINDINRNISLIQQSLQSLEER